MVKNNLQLYEVKFLASVDSNTTDLDLLLLLKESDNLLKGLEGVGLVLKYLILPESRSFVDDYSRVATLINAYRSDHD